MRTFFKKKIRLPSNSITSSYLESTPIQLLLLFPSPFYSTVFFNSWPSTFMGFTYTDSTNHRSKTIFNPQIEMWMWMQRTMLTAGIVLHYFLLETWALQILVYSGILKPIPHEYQGPTVVKFWGNQQLYRISYKFKTPLK